MVCHWPLPSPNPSRAPCSPSRMCCVCGTSLIHLLTIYRICAGRRCARRERRETPTINSQMNGDLSIQSSELANFSLSISKMCTGRCTSSAALPHKHMAWIQRKRVFRINSLCFLGPHFQRNSIQRTSTYHPKTPKAKKQGAGSKQHREPFCPPGRAPWAHCFQTLCT